MAEHPDFDDPQVEQWYARGRAPSTDDTEEEGAVVRVGKPERGPASDHWTSGRAEIVPSPQAQAQEIVQRAAADIVRGTAEPPAQANVQPWQQPAETVSEVGTPVHRATATLIRAAPLILLVLPVGLAIVWALDVWWAWLIPLWGGLGIVVYLAVVWLDLVHNSPSSTERHRINKAAQLETLKAKQAHELRRAVVEAFIDYMKGKGGGHAG